MKRRITDLAAGWRWFQWARIAQWSSSGDNWSLTSARDGSSRRLLRRDSDRGATLRKQGI